MGTFKAIRIDKAEKGTIAALTQFDEADVTDLEEFRKNSNTAMAKSGIKLTMLAFVIKASVAALKKFPAFNASLDAGPHPAYTYNFFTGVPAPAGAGPGWMSPRAHTRGPPSPPRFRPSAGGPPCRRCPQRCGDS